jgi:hypothetical protein
MRWYYVLSIKLFLCHSTVLILQFCLKTYGDKMNIITKHLLLCQGEDQLFPVEYEKSAVPRTYVDPGLESADCVQFRIRVRAFFGCV